MNEMSPHAATVSKSQGRLGLLLVLVGTGLVVVWLGVRVSTTVASKKALEVERSAVPDPALEIPEVRISQLTRATWTPSVPLEGTIEASQRAELGFKVGGRLASVEVRLGDRVKAGRLLGRLDAGEASAPRTAASAQVDAAAAQVVLAEDKERRTATLVTSGAMTDADRVQAEQGRALAVAQAASAQAQLGLMATTLSNHALVAPFDGVITRAPSTRGAVVGAGQALFEIVDDSSLRLRGTVSETDAALVRAGARVKISTQHGDATGNVRAVVGVLDAATRRVPVEADLDPNNELLVGSFVRATIAGTEPIDVWKLPAESLRPGSQDTLLVVVNDKLEERTIVFTTEGSSGSLLVRRGLNGDEKVVLSPRPEARSGDAVRISTAAAEKPAVTASQKASKP